MKHMVVESELILLVILYVDSSSYGNILRKFWLLQTTSSKQICQLLWVAQVLLKTEIKKGGNAMMCNLFSITLFLLNLL